MRGSSSGPEPEVVLREGSAVGSFPTGTAYFRIHQVIETSTAVTNTHAESELVFLVLTYHWRH